MSAALRVANILREYVLILFQLHKNKHVPDMFMFRVWGVLFPMKLRVKIRWGSSKKRPPLAMPAARSYGRDSRARFACVQRVCRYCIRFPCVCRVAVMQSLVGDRYNFTV